MSGPKRNAARHNLSCLRAYKRTANDLSANKKNGRLADSGLFSDTNGGTKHGSGWRRDVAQ